MLQGYYCFSCHPADQLSLKHQLGIPLSGHGINKLQDKLCDLLRQLHVELLRCVQANLWHFSTTRTLKVQ